MKRIASRVLALVVALSMLLASTAMAAERNAATLSIGNFEITVGEEAISLPVVLSIGGGADIEGARGYLTASLSTETATALSALAAYENNEIKAYLSGMNYGLVIPFEQLVALLEDEMGMTMEEAMAELMAELEGAFDAETQAAITGMLESAAALENVEIAPEAALAALGITLTEKGQTTVSLFDTEAAATEYALEMKTQTYKEMFDSLMALDPALAEYMNQYFAMMNEALAAEGEEMTIEDALAMITIGAAGTIYEAENGALINVTMTMSVEDESIEIPLNIVTLTDELGTYTQVALLMEVDSESAYIDVYVDDYAAEGVDYGHFTLSFMVGDTDAEESDTEFTVSVVTTAAAESSTLDVAIYANDYGEEASIGFGYLGYPVVSTEAYDSYDGMIYVYADAEGVAVEAYADTNLTLSSVPEGELLTFTESINPLEADEDVLAQLTTDVQNALIQSLGVLMQDSTLAALIGGMMG